MDFKENDLEEIIYTSDADKICERGMYAYHSKLFRQVRIGNYGSCDLLGFNRPRYMSGVKIPGVITIYELKKDELSVSAFFQTIRYLKGVKSYLSKRGKDEDYKLEIVLIGKETKEFSNKNDLIYLPDIFPHLSEFSYETEVRLYTYSYGIDGITFKEYSGWKLINEGF